MIINLVPEDGEKLANLCLDDATSRFTAEQLEEMTQIIAEMLRKHAKETETETAP
jgi:hypothetical protein